MQPNSPTNSDTPLNLEAIGVEATPTSPAARRSAEQEAAFYAADKKKRGHKRDQFSKDVVHYGSVVFLIIVGIGLVAGFFTWAVHQILPPRYLWLDDSHVGHLAESGKVLLSGTIGALGSKFLTRNIEPD